MNNIVIGLHTVELVSTTPSFTSTPKRADKMRVFTDDEWIYLNTLSIAELENRIRLGNNLIDMLYRPELLNMTSKQADALTSNLRYQQDAIRAIITQKETYNGSR